MNKTLTKKFVYIIAALAMLAMLIPAAAVPVSAAAVPAPGLNMTLVDPLNNSTTTADSGYNVTGSRVLVTASLTGSQTITSWNIANVATAPGAGPAVFIGTPVLGGTGSTAMVQGIWGDAVISATISDNSTISVEKKWGQIANTVITPSGSTAVVWSEANKSWSANATITDTVNGTFFEKDNSAVAHVAQGTILNWYLVPGNVVVPMTSNLDSGPLKAAMLALTTPGPVHVNFSTGGHTAQTVTGANGQSSVSLMATGEEAVQVVVVPEYPFGLRAGVNIPIVPEITSYDFYTTEMDVVPQVRWAGEKIVLEKNFGTTYTGQWVKFALQNQSVGSLEGIAGFTNFLNGDAVWTQIDANGFASVILVSSDEGVSQVTAGLYSGFNPDSQAEGVLINQHFFTVFFLKLESLTLGDVQGKRVNQITGAHDSGIWTLPSTIQPSNPWDPAGLYNVLSGNLTIPDQTTQTLNVSADALLRARVTGWFTSSNPSARPARYIDPTNDPTFTDATPTNGTYPSNTLLLPAGRWILPGDWAALAGPNWQQSRLHWDIMNNPDASVGALNSLALPWPVNAYKMPPLTGTVVSGPNVIGPFSPGLELMTPTGWAIPNPGYDALRPISTVVPDGKLNMWDAPMPPAKIIFQIQKVGTTLGADAKPMDQAGFFKSTDKEDVYYWMVPNNTTNPVSYTKIYTNPFYMEMIPAHEAIPAFINNGGYDWNSFDASYGPYKFWNFINQSSYIPLVSTSDPSGHPTDVEVYSDNHGEAMVWLNGNWNLDLSNWGAKGYADIPLTNVVGTTTVQATADYPYSRFHQPVQSNKDIKTWTWGGQVLGTDGPSSGVFGDHVTTSVPADTRMVLSAGSYDNSSKIGVYPNQAAKSNDKVVWVWVTDRDGSRAGIDGAQVTWTIDNGTQAKINTSANGYLSNYNSVTQNIFLSGGFLNNTGGTTTSSTVGKSFLRVPTATEILLFNKFWGTPPNPNPANNQNSTSAGGTSNIKANAANYEVAAIDLVSLVSLTGRANVTIEISSQDFGAVMGQTGTSSYNTNVDFTQIDALDDGIRTGDANCDGIVNMIDVTAIEKMILGYSGISSNAVLNSDGTVDMGTVVKVERIILGLN